MTTRRDFIARMASATALLALPPAWKAIDGTNRLKAFGFISGIVGRELKADWKGTLSLAAKYGFTEIETGDHLGDSVADFLSFCKAIGLKPFAGGIDFNASTDDKQRRLDGLKQMGLTYAVAYWPWFTGGPFSVNDCKRSADALNSLGAMCRNHGLVLCWHNHNKEFLSAGEGLPFDFLMLHTDPDLVKCELDIYWARKGGADPVGLLQKYRGRYPILHIKDMGPGEAQDFECPGNGIIDFAPIFREAINQKISHFIVERDNAPNGLDCLSSSARYLKELRF